MRENRARFETWGAYRRREAWRIRRDLQMIVDRLPWWEQELLFVIIRADLWLRGLHVWALSDAGWPLVRLLVRWRRP